MYTHRYNNMGITGVLYISSGPWYAYRSIFKGAGFGNVVASSGRDLLDRI